ncbi:hypothetical protein BX666DRAFT_2103977 [Dichotomocladium elegans]|nr:hypothetical protein BX666DRAFT_2103977 [Dichotomocladium elegans]
MPLVLAAKRKGCLKSVLSTYALMRKRHIPLTLRAYNLVLDALAKFRKKGTPLFRLLKVYDEMITSQIQPSSYTHIILIQALCRRDVEVQKTIAMLRRQETRMCRETDGIDVLEAEQNLEHALSIFRKASKQRHTQEFKIELYNQILRVLSHYGDKPNAFFVYDHLNRSSHPKPNAATYAALINLYGRAGDIDGALTFYKEYHAIKSMTAEHDASYVYNALVDAYLKCNRLDDALNIIENDMVRDNIKVTIVPYNSVIRYYCANHAVEAARTLIGRLVNVTSDLTLPRPDASSYGPVLSALCKANQYASASEVYVQLLATDITKAYGNLANYAFLCISHGKHEAALAVIRDMRCAHLEPDTELARRIVLSYASAEGAVFAYTTIIEAMSPCTIIKGTDMLIEMALQVLSRISEIDVALSFFNTLKKRFRLPVAAHRVLLDVYDHQNEERLKSNIDYTPVLVSAMIVGDIRLARVTADLAATHYRPQPALYSRVLLKLEELGLDTDPWKSTLICHHQEVSDSGSFSSKFLLELAHGHGKEAVRMLEHILRTGRMMPAPEVMRDAIAAIGKRGDLTSAARLYSLCCKAGYDDRSVFLLQNSLLVVYAQQGDVINAKRCYDAIKAKGLFPDGNAYASLLLCKAHDVTDEAAYAIAIYDEVKRHNIKPGIFFYNVVISKFAKTRKLELALQLFDEMDCQPNCITYGAMISACVRAGSEMHARRIFGEMLSSASYRPRVGPFNSMIQLYVHQHPDRERALGYVKEMRRREIKPSAHTYKLIMEAYATIAPYDMPAAYRMLSEMVRRDKITPLATHYATLIYSYGFLQRDVQSAEQVFLQMSKANVAPDETVYQALLDMLISNGLFRRAEELYNSAVSKIQKRASPYIENIFLREYGRNGNVAMAEKMFYSMSDNKFSSSPPVVVREPSTYETMVKIYLENGMSDKAKDIFNLMIKRGFPNKVLATAARLVTE